MLVNCSLAAYEFAATNSVIEIGIVIRIVLSPTFTVADFAGGFMRIILLASGFKYVVPDGWIKDAREHARNLTGRHSRARNGRRLGPEP